MKINSVQQENKHWLVRMLIVVAAGICLLLGVIGIVLPVIPGLLFLALALWLIARVSRRAAHYLDSNPHWRRQQRFWDRARFLPTAQRLQLGFWLAGRLLIEGSGRLYEKVRATVKGRS